MQQLMFENQASNKLKIVAIGFFAHKSMQKFGVVMCAKTPNAVSEQEKSPQWKKNRPTAAEFGHIQFCRFDH